MTEPDPSYLSTFGITNPWTIWLLGADSALVAYDADAITRRPLKVPDCPGSHKIPKRMSYRPGAFKCYDHPEPVVVLIKPEIPRAPNVNALALTGKMLDYQYDHETGRWHVVPLEVQ